MEYKKRLKEIKKILIEKEKKALNKSSTVNIYGSFDMNFCLCTDSKNHFKDLYASKYEAKRVAKFLLNEQGIALFVYPCPYSYGWHLTRR
jgi:hypothetical protein